MNIKKKQAIGIGALSMFGALIAFSAYAYSPENMKMDMHAKNPAYEAIHKAVTNNDYTSFKTATAGIKKPGGAPEITEAIFAKIVEAEKLRASGDMAGAKKIMTELGFKKPAGHHDMRKGGMKHQNLTLTQKEAMKQAHTLFKAGKTIEAQKMLTDAGIKLPTKNINK